MLKRGFCLLLALTMAFCFCACKAEQQPVLAAETELAPNGVVQADVFETLQKEKGTASFRGESAGVIYTWTVFGSKIQTPHDCNLTVRVLEANKSRIKLRFDDGAQIDFLPDLKLQLPLSLPVQVAAVYQGGVEEDLYICAASVTEHNGAQIEIPAVSPVGNWVIVPVMPDLSAESEAAEPLVSATAQEEEEPQIETTAAPSPETTTAEPKTARTFSFFDFLKRPTAAQPASSEPESSKPAVSSKPTEKPTAAPPQTTKPQAQTCTLSIECASVFAHMEDLDPAKREVLPEDGVILAPTTVELQEKDTAFSVLQRVCRAQGIPMEASFTPLEHSAYVEGIGNLYEFDCGPQSGWMYRVNGIYPNFSASACTLSGGDTVEFRYTCDLGADIDGKDWN